MNDQRHFQKVYRSRQWQRVLATAALLTTAIVWFDAKKPLAEWLSWGIKAGLAVSVIGLLYVGHMWRCPACEQAFGRRWNVPTCPRCKVKLED